MIRFLSFIALFMGTSGQLSVLSLAASDSGGKTHENLRMVNASSPYLRIHASDDVQWYEWSEETFKLARKLNRPLMVSFGYTACHWCHVMQETHFTQDDIAKTINENFIPVIVDRERRPVLDETYMLVTEVLTNRGGWPNTVFMTPDRKPFYGTGYIPAEQFRKILSAVVDSWKTENNGVLAEADRLSVMLERYLTRKEDAREISPELLAKAAGELAGQFDEFVGGFGGAPKFFQQSILMFLLQQGERNNDQAALAAVELTLQSIISGGIHDHIEGGLHRYTVDPGWRIPHFEKMLYDQSLMAEAFVAAYRITGKAEYGAMARRIIDYVLADLTSPEGGFYATRDADSEGEEGTYYVWSQQQLSEVLGAEDAAYAIEIFEQVSEGELAGKVILNRDKIRGQSVPRIDAILAKLGAVRSKREKPQRDEKIVANWNGMMIVALARAALVLEDETYGKAALKAGRFLWNNLRDGKGELLRSYFAGRAEVKAELTDYAHLTRAFTALYDLTGKNVWLDRASGLLSEMDTRFGDADNGDFYSSQTASGFGRAKSRQDSDLASGNGVALAAMVGVAKRQTGPQIERRTEKLIAALSGFAAASPASGASILAATDRFFQGESGSVQYGGKGNVRVRATQDSDRVRVHIKVAKGWHINANKPLEDYLIPTQLTVKSKSKTLPAKVVYPKPQIKTLGFSKEPLALLEDEVNISAATTVEGTKIFELEIQACSDEICLAPDTLKFRISPPLPRG